MTSIWAFLLQTLSVSLVAALLLLVKAILATSCRPDGSTASGAFSRCASSCRPRRRAGTSSCRCRCGRKRSRRWRSGRCPPLIRRRTRRPSPASLSRGSPGCRRASRTGCSLSISPGRRRLRCGTPSAIFGCGRCSGAAVPRRKRSRSGSRGLRGVWPEGLPRRRGRGLPSAFVAGIARPVLAVPDGGIPTTRSCCTSCCT